MDIKVHDENKGRFVLLVNISQTSAGPGKYRSAFEFLCGRLTCLDSRYSFFCSLLTCLLFPFVSVSCPRVVILWLIPPRALVPSVCSPHIFSPNSLPGGSYFRWIRLWWPRSKVGHGGMNRIFLRVDTTLLAIIMFWTCKRSENDGENVEACKEKMGLSSAKLTSICFPASQPQLYPGR